MFYSKHKWIFVVCLLGFIARLLYVVFISPEVAQHYFNASSLFTDQGDFHDWLTSIKNLVEIGTYTVNPENEYGYFSRMPGYAFFIGFFYYLFGSDSYLYAIGYTQVLLDSITIYFIYCIYNTLFPNNRYPYFAAIVYALHPIVIFWAPCLFAESLSVFLLIFALYIYVCKTSTYNYFTTGILLGLGILVRPQIAVFAFVMIAYESIRFIRYRYANNLSKACLLVLGVLLTYGWWPFRNYVFHHQLVMTHDIRGIDYWGPDVYSYMQYIFSIQTNWEPQFSQIITHGNFTVDPSVAYAVPGDSALLAEAIYLAQNYGSGFSCWSGHWKGRIDPNPADAKIVALFDTLHQHQVRYNSFHYWVIHPLMTLKKCLFKNSLSQPLNGYSAYLTSFIFYLRSISIILGILGCLLAIKNREHPAMLLIFAFFILWYLVMCFGPTGFMRNVEFRYLLQTDSLMIIPFAYCIDCLYKARKTILRFIS